MGLSSNGATGSATAARMMALNEELFVIMRGIDPVFSRRLTLFVQQGTLDVELSSIL